MAFGDMFKKTKSYSMTISRAVSEMETIQCLLTTNDINDFPRLLQTAESAIQWRADQFQKQVEAVEKAMADGREARAKKAGK